MALRSRVGARLLKTVLVSITLFALPMVAAAQSNFEGQWVHRGTCTDTFVVTASGGMGIKVSGPSGCYNDQYQDRIKRETNAGFQSNLLECRASDGGLLCRWPKCSDCEGWDLFKKVK